MLKKIKIEGFNALGCSSSWCQSSIDIDDISFSN